MQTSPLNNRLRTLCFYMALLGSAHVSLPYALAGQMHTILLPGGATIDMVRIPAGSFEMGSPDTESGRKPNESPTHPQTIEEPFYLGRYELTQEQWESVMETRPWKGKQYVKDQPHHPAVYISWNAAQAFIARLNAFAGDSLYRLPTEAEWEYACRAGTNARWSSGNAEDSLGAHAWYRKNLARRFARIVGRKRPNSWGLYDMHGNVWEWVQDGYGPYGAPRKSDYVNRGGSFYDPAIRLRSAYRNHDVPSYRSADTGLRLLRRIP